jgi:hypothetical protein
LIVYRSGRSFAYGVEAGRPVERHHHVQPVATSRLHERRQPQLVLENAAQVERHLPRERELVPGRIEVEDQLIRLLQLIEPR